MLSEISGSWTGSLFIGFWFTVVFEALRKHKYGDDDEDHEIEDEESGEGRKIVWAKAADASFIPHSLHFSVSLDATFFGTL